MQESWMLLVENKSMRYESLEWSVGDWDVKVCFILRQRLLARAFRGFYITLPLQSLHNSVKFSPCSQNGWRFTMDQLFSFTLCIVFIISTTVLSPSAATGKWVDFELKTFKTRFNSKGILELAERIEFISRQTIKFRLRHWIGCHWLQQLPTVYLFDLCIYEIIVL